VKSFRLTPSVAAAVTPDAIAEVSQLPGVERIWPDVQVHTCLDRSVSLIGVPAVWSAGYTGRGQRIAVIDTGVDTEHPDLLGRVVATHDVTGEGFFDKNGHGTHVCGIAAGAGRTYRGVAPGAELVVAKVLKSNGFGQMSWVMEGLEWAVAQPGVRVINMSLGANGPTDGTDPLSQTADAAVAKGIVICVAGGNEGPASGTIGSPGGARRVITVGALTDAETLADFSSRGPTTDGRAKPDVLFPGHGIVAARARGSSMGQVVDELYTQASGTSMACPHAAGAAALLLEANPRLTPADVKAIFMATALDLGLGPNLQGKGRARIDLALGRDPSTAPREPEPGRPAQPGGPGSGSAAAGCLTVLPRLLWRR
jgi:serine protease AprX